MENPVVSFLLNNEEAHPDGYTPDEIVNHWLNRDLEGIHNWVQWAFPTDEESKFRPEIPFLSPRDIAKIRRSTVIQRNLDDLMYRAIDFYDQTVHWLRPHDHNHLRITRIIKSMALLAPRHKAQTFYHFIRYKVAASRTPLIINPESVAHWEKAIAGAPYYVPTPMQHKAVDDSPIARVQAMIQEGDI